MRHARTVLITAIVSGLSLALGVGPAQSQANKPEPRSAPPSAAAARIHAVEAQGERALGFAEARKALTTYFDETTSEHVVVVSRGADVDAAQARKAVGAATRIEQRDITKSTIDSINAAVKGRAFHADAATYTYASYFDGRSGKVILKTDAPSSVTEPLTAQFGDALDLRAGGPQLSFGRRSDTAPYWGGASIKSGGGTCTSNFAVQKNGVRYMATAGHCFTQGSNVYTSDSNAWVGSVVERAGLPTYDMELDGGSSYGNSIYTGGANSTTSKRVASATNPVVGVTGYCFSGQTSGEKCNQKVESLTATVCTELGCTPNVIQFSGTAPLKGDSGGPFYWPDSTTVYARGLVIASNFSGTGWAEKWSSISARFGVTIVT